MRFYFIHVHVFFIEIFDDFFTFRQTASTRNTVHVLINRTVLVASIRLVPLVDKAPFSLRI